MEVLLGSARIDERGNVAGGKAGDQKQKTNSPDWKGEVSVTKYYTHKQGWDVLRPVRNAHELALAMLQACNNPNVGYDQANRGDILSKGTKTTVPAECDCSSLVRQCIKEAMGVDVGNFTTLNEKTVLLKSGLFKRVSTTVTGIMEGDVFITRTQGHTEIAVQGNQAVSSASVTYFKKYTGSTTSITDALKKIGEDNSFSNRKKIAAANGIANYSGTATQNTKMLKLLKEGKLIKP